MPKQFYCRYATNMAASRQTMAMIVMISILRLPRSSMLTAGANVPQNGDSESANGTLSPLIVARPIHDWRDPSGMREMKRWAR